MRQGESLSLKWDHINFETSTVDASCQLQSLPYVHGRSGELRVPNGCDYRRLDGGLCLVRPKTAKGQRLFSRVPWMAATLTTWSGVAPASPHNLFWPRPNSRPQASAADAAAWRQLQDATRVAKVDGKSGRRYQLHEACHTTATLLLQVGIDPEVVKGVLGHSTIVSTRVFQHVNQCR